MAGRVERGVTWDNRASSVILLGLAHLFLGLVILSQLTSRDGYLERYQHIHDANGVPYRDFKVEYPPVLLVTAKALAADDIRETEIRLAALSLVLDGSVALSLSAAAGRRATARYLALSLPLVPFTLMSLEILAVALAVGGALLAERSRERSGGVLLGLAVMTKIWPLVIVIGLFVRRRTRAAAWALVTIAIVSAAWLAWGGLGGPGQVLTFRGAGGWELGSLIGSVLWLSGRSAVPIQGAYRVGSAPAWAKVGLLALLGIVLATIVRRARQKGATALGAPELASVSALLVASPVLSYPYPAWMTPWAALADPAGPWFRLTLLVTTLTAGSLLATSLGAPHRTVASIFLARDLAILAIVGLSLRRAKRASGAAPLIAGLE